MAGTDWLSLKKEAQKATEALPDGKYPIEVEAADAVFASTGSQMIKIVCRVTAGEYEGRKLWTNLVLSKDSGFALDLFFKRIEALGVTETFLASGVEFDDIARALVGKRAVADIFIRTTGAEAYRGRNEISMFYSDGNIQVSPTAAGVPNFGPTSTPKHSNTTILAPGDFPPPPEF